MRGQTGRPFPHSMFDDSAPFATAFFYKYGQQATTAPQFFWDGTTVAARQHEGRGKKENVRRDQGASQALILPTEDADARTVAVGLSDGQRPRLRAPGHVFPLLSQPVVFDVKWSGG